MTDDRAAVAAGLLPGDDLHRSLLRSIVDVARAIFRARAASVFLLDTGADQLVFEAVSGEGEESLLGRRFPSSTGIAGWVLVTGQSLVLDDVSADPRFASQAAESTGYVPKSIMAVPLVSGENTIGVLEVLDRPSGERFTMEEADLLGMFATQAAAALDLLERSRSARRVLSGAEGADSPLTRLAAALEQAEPEDREATLAMLRAAEALLTQRRGGARRGGPPRRAKHP
jgi:GAF domain-containing protein